jgi:hypothetical protein
MTKQSTYEPSPENKYKYPQKEFYVNTYNKIIHNRQKGR